MTRISVFVDVQGLIRGERLGHYLRTHPIGQAWTDGGQRCVQEAIGLLELDTGAPRTHLAVPLAVQPRKPAVEGTRQAVTGRCG